MSIDKLFAMVGEAFLNKKIKDGNLFGELPSYHHPKPKRSSDDEVRRRAEKKGRRRKKAISKGDKSLS